MTLRIPHVIYWGGGQIYLLRIDCDFSPELTVGEPTQRGSENAIAAAQS